jgi:TPR repeat protein
VAAPSTLYSFDYAYILKSVRNWLFHQAKETSAKQLYDKGKAVQNDKQAFSYFKQAAELDYGLAQHKVGQAYEKGLGVKQDIAQAIVWYQVAAKDNDVAAIAAIKRLS